MVIRYAYDWSASGAAMVLDALAPAGAMLARFTREDEVVLDPTPRGSRALPYSVVGLRGAGSIGVPIARLDDLMMV